LDEKQQTQNERRQDTAMVWLGTRQQLAKLTTTKLPLFSALVVPSSAVLDLGVNIDSS